VGEPVAFIVAETIQAARDAAEAVEVTYEPGNPITDLAKALDPDAPLVWPEVPGNRVFDWEIGDAARTAALFDKAPM